MKTKILTLAIMALAMTALVGCGSNSEDNKPAAANSPGDQPMPGVNTSNNVIAQPVDQLDTTNNPALTNLTSTNSPPATNQ
jgi:hypothetical protein